jgi:hypothetical protein
MKRRIHLAVIAIAASCVNVLATEDLVPAARTAATTWLASLDARDYEITWRDAAGIFKGAVSVQTWRNAATAARGPLGTMQKREEKISTATRNIPGAPEGQYVLLQYATIFEKNSSAIETVTLVQEPTGEFRVAGYFVK